MYVNRFCELETSPPIRLGVMAPLSGLVEMYGAELVHAAQIACDEVNLHGGVLGRRLEVVVADDGSLPATAVPAAQRLLKQYGCAALIGNLLSNSRIAVAEQVADPCQIPYLNFSSYEGGLASRYAFHFAALPNQQIDKMIGWMGRHYGLKMFFAGNNYEWPRGSIDAAKRALQRLGGAAVGEVYLPLHADTQQINRLLEAVTCSGADVFVPYFAGGDQIAVLSRFHALGLKQHMAVVMGQFDEVMASRMPSEVRDGFYTCNSYFMSLDSPENRRYLQQLVCQPGIAGIWPHGNGMLTNIGESAYLCVHAFAQAVQMAGSIDAQALIPALEHVYLHSPQGIVVMDPETHHAAVNSYMARCDSAGMFHIVESFGQIPPCIPERYRDQHEFNALYPAVDAVKGVHGTGDQLQAQHILSLVDSAILAADELGLINDANDTACQMFGYTRDEMLGMSLQQLVPPPFRQRHAELIRHFVASDDCLRRMAARNEVTGYRKDGSFFPLEVAIAKFRNAERWTLVATLHDVSERQQNEEALLWRSTHDPLTGLGNRVLFRERLVGALERSRRLDLSIALLFVDLDNFKLVNDMYGHEIGDELLKCVAQRLIAQVRPGDTVAHFAGDEFIILCEQLKEPEAISLLAEHINIALRCPVELAGMSLSTMASIGVAIGHGNTHEADGLLRAADTAMYAAKEKGRDGWRLFHNSQHEHARQRLTILQGLRLAVEHNELSPRFQPIVSMENGRVVGGELLLRWHTPSGEISPAVFIPIAESGGAIVAIGYWVFRQACMAELAWRSRWGETAPYVSVNVSARQLDEDKLVEAFQRILLETGADPRRLLLEITETALMADIEINRRTLCALANLGLRVAVDDFGTGYSSLAQLTRLPVSVLKIDRAFVDGMAQKENRTVTLAIIQLGKALGLKLVAEGVECISQLQALRIQECDAIQGYYFHRPLEMQQFIEVVSAEQQALYAHSTG